MCVTTTETSLLGCALGDVMMPAVCVCTQKRQTRQRRSCAPIYSEKCAAKTLFWVHRTVENTTHSINMHKTAATARNKQQQYADDVHNDATAHNKLYTIKAVIMMPESACAAWRRSHTLAHTHTSKYAACAHATQKLVAILTAQTIIPVIFCVLRRRVPIFNIPFA